MSYHRTITVTCEAFNITVQEFHGRCRRGRIVIARDVFVYICQAEKYQPKLFSELGKLSGGRDRTSAYNSYVKIRDQLNQRYDGKYIRDYVAEIKSQLNEIYDFAETIQSNIL